MKLIFENFNFQLCIKKGLMNLVYIEHPILFSNIVYSVAGGYQTGSHEPVYLFDDDGKELSSERIWFVGDICTLDLNDRRILSKATKQLEKWFIENVEARDTVEKTELSIQEVFEEWFHQCQGNYSFLTGWDLVKYVKALGFGVDATSDATLFDKLLHFTQIVTDLFPEIVLCFIHLKQYLSEDQYREFSSMIAANSLYVLLCEKSQPSSGNTFENYVHIDSDFIENSNQIA